jgi:long-subunit acyl-CoA synthetase (AMP-forming)
VSGTHAYRELSRGWARHAGRIALDDGRARIDYAELDGLVADTARELSRLDARRPGLVAENGIGWALVQLAALRSDLPLVALPTFFSAAQRAAAVAEARLDVLVTDADAPDGGGGGKRRAALHVPGLCAFATGVSPTRAAEPFERVTFTSGSSGTPRGVKLAHDALLTVAGSLREATDMRADDRHLCALPLSVLLEEVGGLLRGLGAGARVLLLPAAERGLAGSTGFDPERFGRAL